MKRKNMRMAVGIVLVASTFLTPAFALSPKVNPAEYTINVHVSYAQYDPTNGIYEILTATINGRHYQLEGFTSSARTFMHGNGLLNAGDYRARLTKDEHKTSFESLQAFELLLPDDTTRSFSVIGQGE
jgi:hypothetical protein